MTRRLTMVLVAVVVTTLLLSGAGTLLLASARARSSTEASLRGKAVDISAGLDDLMDVGVPVDSAEGQRLLRQRLRVLAKFRDVLSLDGIAVLTGGQTGELDFTDLPAPLTAEQLPEDLLRPGVVYSGTVDRTAFAVAPAIGPGGRLYVVVVTQEVNAGLGAGIRLFLWAAAATILLAVGAAWWLGRHLTKPIRDVAVATQHLAAGQLSTRVETPPASRHDELADLQRSVNDMAATMERSRGLEQQFLLSVSHDLRTPLTSIRGYAEAITDGAGDPARAAGVIRSEAQRLERLVADLLDLAKLQAHTFSFDLRAVDLTEAVRTACVGAAGSRPGVSFHPFSRGPVAVMADPDRLAQALANLTENAGKYARSAVTLMVESGGARATVTVDDDGPGIAEHDLPHVFERLYVARHVPERRENASGLGLAIVRELVTGMGGDVGAGRAPNGGARLWFRLPVAGPPAGES